MFSVSKSVRANADRAPGQPTLTRHQIWQGLLKKAENALPYVKAMTHCELKERGEGYLLREIEFRGERAMERVTFEPERKVTYTRQPGCSVQGFIENEILDADDGDLELRFTFNLALEGVAEGSEEERSYAATMEADYLKAVQATLEAIRRSVAEQQIA